MADGKDRGRRADVSDGFRVLSPGTIALPPRPGTVRAPVPRGQLRRTDLLSPSLDDLPDWLKIRCHMELAGRDETDEGVVVLYPGSSLRVVTAIEFIEATELTSARIGLRFTATGSGSPETHEFVRRTFAAGRIAAGRIVEHDLVMRVPDNAPMSYEGVYVKILWSVVLEFAEPEGHVHEEAVPLLVRPRPAAWVGDPTSGDEAVVGEDAADAAARERAESEVADPADPDDIDQPADDEPVPMGDERAPTELVEAEAADELVDQPDPAGENIDADEPGPEDGVPSEVAPDDEDDEPVRHDTIVELVEPGQLPDDDLDTVRVDSAPGAGTDAPDDTGAERDTDDTAEDDEALATVEVPEDAGAGPVRSFYGADEEEAEPHLRDFYMGSDTVNETPETKIRVSDAGSARDTLEQRKPSGETGKAARTETQKKPRSTE